MGTFHDDRGELHGITVVVDTDGPVYVGRCDEMNERGIVLLNADEHAEGQDGRSKEEFVQRAAKFGFWDRHTRLVVPADRVRSVKRLGEVE